jgi:hypothetical protein
VGDLLLKASFNDFLSNVYNITLDLFVPTFFYISSSFKTYKQIQIGNWVQICTGTVVPYLNADPVRQNDADPDPGS